MTFDIRAQARALAHTTRILPRLLAIGVFAGALLAAGVAAQAEPAQPQDLTPEQKAKIEAARKKREQLKLQNPNGAANPNGAQGRQNHKAFRKGPPADAPAAGQDNPAPNPAVKTFRSKKFAPPPAAASNGEQPPAASNENQNGEGNQNQFRNRHHRPFGRKPGAPSDNSTNSDNSNAQAPVDAPPRKAFNPAFPAAPGAVKAPQAVNPAYPAAPQATDPAFSSFRRARMHRRPPDTPPPTLEAIKQQRQKIVTKRSDAVVIKEPDSRVIVKRNNRTFITHNESERFRRVAPNAMVERRNGQNVTVIQRPNNISIYNVTDSNGQLIRRYRRGPDGREVDIIDNRRKSSKWRRNLAIGLGVGAGIVAGAAILNSVVDVPPPHVGVPRDKYIVDYDDADEDDVYEAFSAPPVDRIERRYTLDEVRATRYLRERMRRVDLSDITFETGSWEVDESQYHKLERAARAMMRVIDRNPNEVFMVEGYTDAVGSEEDNLTLSDRRAESVAVILSEEFNVPPENLTTQGYGEQYLKIETDGPERANRRVALRRITPLISDRR